MLAITPGQHQQEPQLGTHARTSANMALPGMGDPSVTTCTSAAGHVRAAQAPAIAATPPPRLCPRIKTLAGCVLLLPEPAEQGV